MSRKKKPREVRFCGCDCGGSKEVLVTSTWKYFAGHNLRVNNPMERPEIVAKMADTKRGRTKENHPGTAAQAEKMRGRTKETHTGVAAHSRKMMGRKQSKEEKVKRVETRKNSGKPWHSEETKGKIGNGNLGENNGNWQGGIGNLPYPFEFNEEFKELVRERYDYTCMLCKLIQKQVGHTLRVHHIDYDKDNLDPDNFVPLCLSCHGVTIGKNNRTYWTKVFQKIVEMNNSFKVILDERYTD